MPLSAAVTEAITAEGIGITTRVNDALDIIWDIQRVDTKRAIYCVEQDQS